MNQSNNKHAKHAAEKKPNYALRRAVALGTIVLASFGIAKAGEGVYNFFTKGHDPVPVSEVYKDGSTHKVITGLNITPTDYPLSLRSTCEVPTDDNGNKTDENLVQTLDVGQTLNVPVAFFVEGDNSNINSFRSDDYLRFPYKGGTACMDLTATLPDVNIIHENGSDFEYPTISNLGNSANTTTVKIDGNNILYSNGQQIPDSKIITTTDLGK